MTDNHVVLPIHVGDDEKPFRIVLDTGMPARGLILYDSPRVDALDLDFDAARITVGGAGGRGERISARVAGGVRLRLGQLELPPTQALVLPPMSHHFGFNDGIIGAELFRRFTVAVDFTRERLLLHEPAAFDDPDGAVALPLEFTGGIPVVDLTVVALDGSRTAAEVVVDLGAGHAISLNSIGKGALSAPPGSLRTVLGKGLSGDISGRLGRIAALDLGGLILERPIAHFPDLEHQHPRGMNSRQGNLGSEALRRFDVTFDYERKRMWLEPTDRSNQPFEYDMAGLRLGRNAAGELIVKQVFESSPASEAGLLRGDVVIRIDGVDGREIELHELRPRLRVAGKEVTLSYRRGENRRQATLRLRRLV